MKSRLIKKIALLAGISILAISLVTGIAFAATNGDKAQVKQQKCDGSCTSAPGTTTPTKDQTRSRTKSQVCEGTCMTETVLTETVLVRRFLVLQVRHKPLRRLRHRLRLRTRKAARR